MRNLLVVSELALALVLLIGAGLLGKTFWRLTRIKPGFNPARVLVTRIELPEARYREIPAQTQFRDRVLENLDRLPGAQAAMISELPLGGNSINHNFVIEGRPSIAVGDEPELYSRTIAGDYFKVLGIPIVRGRALTAADRAGAPLVGVINQAMARRYFVNQNPIGARIRWARAEGVGWISIVGVVGDVRHFGLGQAEEPAIYTPYAQSGQVWKRWSEVLVRTEGAQTISAAQVKQAIWKIDPLLALPRVQWMTEIAAVSLSQQRFNAFILGCFAATALLLASVGLYGVLAFGVAQRTREIGIRIALGAERSNIFRLVVGQAMLLVGVSMATGVAGAFAATRLLNSMLFGVGASDPITFVGISLLVSVVAFLAAWIPARRASTVNPIVALRTE